MTILRKVHRLLPWCQVPHSPATVGPMPERAIAIVGDTHGCFSLMHNMLQRILAECTEALVILVGDMVARGPESRRVLETVRDSGGRILPLRGNHEEMMLRFLSDPLEHGERWFRHGGLTTLASFGVSGAEADIRTRDALRRAMPAGMEDWLHNLPMTWRSGNLVVTHAGADPRIPIGQQAPESLLWGHPGFGRVPRRDGLWIARGHVVLDRPSCRDGVISVDTGAWRSGKLSAALILPPTRQEGTETPAQETPPVPPYIHWDLCCAAA